MPNGKVNCFADTNLLVYVADRAETKKRELVRDLLALIIKRHTLILSPQSLSECYRVVVHKAARMPRSDARRFVRAWSLYCSAPHDFHVTEEAWRIQDDHGFSWWDCTLLASASLAGCEVFLSEDMAHNQQVAHLTIMNPFKSELIGYFSR